MRAPGGGEGGEGAPLSHFPSSPSLLPLFPHTPFPAARTRGGSPQWSASFSGAPWAGQKGGGGEREGEEGGGGVRERERCGVKPPPVTTPALAFSPSPHPPRSRRRRGPRTHLGDVFLDPVIVPVHAVPPDVGLFGDEDAGLEVREKESGPEGMRRGTRAGGGERGRLQRERALPGEALPVVRYPSVNAR